jgi:hypothetical protein
MKLLLEKIQYEKCNWNFCGGFKNHPSLALFTTCWMSGTLGAENIITSRNRGLKENRLFQDRKM